MAARPTLLVLHYDGGAFAGWQRQPNARTVQADLEDALSRLVGRQVTVIGSGRTDAGVHAVGQAAAATVPERWEPQELARALNALLPRDIAVRAAAEVPLSFNPRRQAVGRWYRYTIYRGSQRPALLRRLAWHVDRPLDTDAMARAAGLLVGRHDFAAFTQPSLAGRRRTERIVARAGLRRVKRLLLFDIEADSYLPYMVRRIVGGLVEVGTGKRSLAGFESLLRQGPPGAAVFTAPARGLCLMKVRYGNGLFDDETDEDI